MRIHEFITCFVKLLLSTRCRGPAFFTWLPKMFGKRVVVTVHGECEIIRGCHNRDKVRQRMKGSATRSSYFLTRRMND